MEENNASDRLTSFLARLCFLEKSCDSALMLNPVFQLAYEVSRDLEAGTLSLPDIETVIFALAERAFSFRARKLHQMFSETVPLQIENSFEVFQEKWSRPIFGAVFTAHPTFLLSRKAHQSLAKAALDDKGQVGFDENFFLEPDSEISLLFEHEWAQESIATCNSSMQDIHKELVEKARKKWPKRWRDFRPEAFSVSSWVGYDMDGRTDINWCTAFRIRIKEKSLQGERLLALFNDAIKDKNIENSPEKKHAKRVQQILERVAQESEMQWRALEKAEKDESLLAPALKQIIAQADEDTTSPLKLKKLLSLWIKESKDDDLIADLIILHSVLSGSGYGTAKLHFRVHATQIQNSLRGIARKTGVLVSLDRSALSELDKKISGLQSVETGFATLQKENTTAMRQMVLIAQFLKYIDRDTEIRFLIAETESTGTLLGALYLATFLGISDHIDISPLFETPDGLEHGAHIMYQLCRFPSFQLYIKKRGRLCAEAGFSDAGRFMGQVPANLAIERFHIKLAASINDVVPNRVEMVMFNTHGESMGRGAHPESFQQRQHYILTPYARQAFRQSGRHLLHEFSFQGGDGWLIFAHKKLADAALRQLLSIEHHIQDDEDPFYQESELILEIFLKLKEFHEGMFRSHGYQSLLGAFGTNFLPVTGSRKTKRQYEFEAIAQRGDPRQMRAIPNNALLQQLGYAINVASGMGIILEHERFVTLYKESPRMRGVVNLVAYALKLSHIDAMAAYGVVLDNGFWAARACLDSSMKKESLLLASLLEEDGRAHAVASLAHKLRLDREMFVDFLKRAEGEEAEGEEAEDRFEDTRLDIGLMHALRIALIMRLYSLAVRLPDFANYDDISRSRVFSMMLSLDINRTIEAFRRIFPYDTETNTLDKLGEKLSYDPSEQNDYARLNDNLIAPMHHIGRRIRHIGMGIACYFGAFG